MLYAYTHTCVDHTKYRHHKKNYNNNQMQKKNMFFLMHEFQMKLNVVCTHTYMCLYIANCIIKCMQIFFRLLIFTTAKKSSSSSRNSHSLHAYSSRVKKLFIHKCGQSALCFFQLLCCVHASSKCSQRPPALERRCSEIASLYIKSGDIIVNNKVHAYAVVKKLSPTVCLLKFDYCV